VFSSARLLGGLSCIWKKALVNYCTTNLGVYLRMPRADVRVSMVGGANMTDRRPNWGDVLLAADA
jgi:hypothetical protein